MKKFCSIAIFICVCACQCIAQQGRYMAVIYADGNLKDARIQKINAFSSEEKRDDFLSKLIKDLRNKNWMEASIDSVYGNDDTLNVFLHLGPQYQFAGELPTTDNVQNKRNGKEDKKKTDELLNLQQTLSKIDQQLIYWQENGYPFATFYWDSISMTNDSLRMSASIQKGPLVIIDSLKNKEDAKVSESFLRSYLGIGKNMPYKESLLSQSDQLLKKLPFARFVRPSTVNFLGDKATMNVYLANRKVSRFDFLMGVLPNNAQTGKILITGEARIQLQNAFKQGEELFMEWKRVTTNSQQLRLKVNYPFILNTPIGVSGSFSLDKRDSTFLDLDWSLGVPFRTKANNYIKALVANKQTIVLNLDTVFVKNFNQLPRIQDVSSVMYGLEGYFENLDFLFNPRKGVEVLAGLQVGTRKIKPNAAVLKLEAPYAQLYDSIDLRSLQIQFKALLNAYIPIAKQQVLKLGVKAEGKYNQQVLDNELFRIGGFNLLRGFDEESLFVQYYAVSTAEYRFILQQNSYMYAFFDAAYTGKPSLSGFQHDFPFGFGAGMAFETKAGIFGISYAVGRQQGNPIDFRTSKLHFGYINVF
jgi:hypothetical protein